MKACVALMFALVLSSISATSAAEDPVWITLDQDSLRLLRSIDPEVRSVQQADLDTGLTTTRGVAITDAVHVVAVSRSLLPMLSQRVHTELHHCGGYLAHDSLADALAALKPARPAAWLTVPSYAITHQTMLTPMLAQVSGSDIEATISSLSAFHNRYADSSYGEDASNWLADKWTAMAAGRTDIHVSQESLPGYSMPSVVLTITGTDLAAQEVVLGAHLDSVNWESGGAVATRRAPGADDDASGVAGLTEVLRVLLDHGYKPERSLTLMAYTAEELGLYGSQAIADDYASRQVDVVGMLQMDMTLYDGSAADIYLISDYTSSEQNQFLESLAETYLPSLSVAYTPCGYGCSDHVSWTDAGYRASFPFEARINPVEDNPNIHSAYDTWANANGPGSSDQAEHAIKFTRLALAYAMEMAGEDGVIFANGFEPASRAGGANQDSGSQTLFD